MTWNGPEALRPFLVPLDAQRADPRNARRHPERNLAAIAASLREFGQRKPIVAFDGVVIAGSGTLEAARGLGWTEIAVVQASDLTPDRARAYAIADNQTGDLATWDAESLRDSLAAVPTMFKTATGFAAEELEAIAALTFGKSPTKVERGPDDGFATIKLTRPQYTIFEGALAKLREVEGDDITPGRAIELLSADFLS